VQEANALIQLVHNLSTFVGPALATLIVISAGFAAAFAFDAATFLVSAALLVRMRPRTRLAAAAAKVAADVRTSTWEALREGYREVRSRQWVWLTLSGFTLAVFLCLAPAYVLSPAIAEEHYGGAEIYGIVAAALGVGTIAGSLIAIRWRPRHPMRLAVIGAMTWPPSELLFAVGAPLPLVLTLCVAAGVGLALFEVWWQTALAERIPPDRLSRVSSYDWTISLGLLPLGYLLAGPLANALSPSEALAWGAVVATLALAMPLLSPAVRRLKRIERPGGGEPPSGEMPLPVP
jgi:hypothetical protein